MQNLNIATLILMGGQNKRMNGQHKAFLTLKDKTFLQIIEENLSIFSNIYLSVNDKNKFSHLSLPMIEDHYSAIGPMGGIYSALLEVPEDYLFVTACDMPYITAEFAHFMKEHLSPNVSCFALYDEEGFYYPLGAIYSKAALPYIEALLEQKCYRMQQLIKKSPSQGMALSDTPFTKAIFTNINTPKEYQAQLGL